MGNFGDVALDHSRVQRHSLIHSIVVRLITLWLVVRFNEISQRGHVIELTLIRLLFRQEWNGERTFDVHVAQEEITKQRVVSPQHGYDWSVNQYILVYNRILLERLNEGEIKHNPGTEFILTRNSLAAMFITKYSEQSLS